MQDLDSLGFNVKVVSMWYLFSYLVDMYLFSYLAFAFIYLYRVVLSRNKLIYGD